MKIRVYYKTASTWGKTTLILAPYITWPLTEQEIIDIEAYLAKDKDEAFISYMVPLTDE